MFLNCPRPSAARSNGPRSGPETWKIEFSSRVLEGSRQLDGLDKFAEYSVPGAGDACYVTKHLVQSL